eukprot:413667-Hanusia_phi.AAC.2
MESAVSGCMYPFMNCKNQLLQAKRLCHDDGYWYGERVTWCGERRESCGVPHGDENSADELMQGEDCPRLSLYGRLHRVGAGRGGEVEVHRSLCDLHGAARWRCDYRPYCTRLHAQPAGETCGGRSSAVVAEGANGRVEAS